MAMTRRRRFLETMTFGGPDRPAPGDSFYYDSTRQRWEAEGLVEGIDLNWYFGMDFDHMSWRIPSSEILPIIPDFSTTILEDTAAHVIRQDPGGEIVKVLKNAPPPQPRCGPPGCRCATPDFEDIP